MTIYQIAILGSGSRPNYTTTYINKKPTIITDNSVKIARNIKGSRSKISHLLMMQCLIHYHMLD